MRWRQFIMLLVAPLVLGLIIREFVEARRPHPAPVWTASSCLWQ